MTLPSLHHESVPSSLDETTVFRSVTGDSGEVEAAPSGYWVTANTQGKDFFGSSLNSWGSTTHSPQPAPFPGAKKLEPLSNVVTRLATLNLGAAVADIPELPDYVERFSSFVSTEKPAAVFAAVVAYFASNKVDYHTESQRKLKITGIAYENGMPVTFKVKFFRHKRDANRCVVEFQRRSGCVVAFTSFYRRVLAQLGGMVQCLYVDDLAASSKQQAQGQGSGLSVMPLPSMAFVGAPTAATGPGQVTLDETSVQTLLDMCLTDGADIKREAIRVLAQASALEQNQAFLTSSGSGAGKSDVAARVVEVITASLPSADREIGRCASLLLANLTQASLSFRARILPLVTTFFTILQRLSEPAATTVGGLLNKEIKRAVSKTLLLLSASNVRDIKSPSPTSMAARREVLQQLARDVDPIVKHNVTATLLAMQDTPAKSQRAF